MKIRCIAFVMCSLSLVSGAHAENDDLELEGLQSLLNEQVVVTASRTLEKTTSAPGLSMVITSTDLRRYGIHTFAEAIDFLSMGMASSNSISGATIGVRGVVLPNDQADHVLTLINGRPESIPLKYPGGLPLEIVDHIEVVLGPGSVIYGTGAMLGVINVILKRAQDFTGIRAGVEADLPTNIRPWASVGHKFKFFGREIGVTSQIEYYNQWGPHIHYGTVNTGLANDGFLMRYTNAPGGTGIWGGVDTQNTYQSGTAVVQLQSGDLEVWGRGCITSGSDEGYPYDFDSPYNRMNTQLGSVGARYRATLSPVVQVAARAFGVYQNQDTVQESSNSDIFFEISPNTYRIDQKVLTPYTDGEVQVYFDWLKDGRLVTMVGFEARLDYLKAQLQTADTRGGATVVKQHPNVVVTDTLGWIISPYVQQAWQATRWLSFNAGLRVDASNRTTTALSPRVAGTAIPWSGGTIKLTYSQAFRAPTLYELYYTNNFSTNFSTQQTVASGGLSPESVHSWEASLEQKVGAHRLTFGVFQSNWSELIELHKFTLAEQAQYEAAHGVSYGPAFQYQNIGSINNTGFQGGIQGVAFGGKLSYALSVTGATARRKDRGAIAQPMDEAPRLFGNARVAYELPDGWPTVALGAHLLSRRPADNAFTGGFVPTPYSPTQFVVRATLTGYIPKLRGLGYRLSANYSAASRDPYVVGPVQNAYASFTAPLLLPVDPFRVTAGIHYEF